MNLKEYKKPRKKINKLSKDELIKFKNYLEKENHRNSKIYEHVVKNLETRK